MKLLRKRKVLIERLKSSTKTYFNETSLHGFRYVTDPRSSKFKSYFWALICLTSTCLCFILIRSQYLTYLSNRITTTIATTSFPIWEVPFPAVTICNFNLVYKDNVGQFRELLENYASPDQIDNFFSNLSSLIITNKDLDWEELGPVTRILQRMGYNTDKLMRALAQPCDKLATECYWSLKQLNCSDIFRQIKTNRGYCCSFNYKGVVDDRSDDDDEMYVSGVGPSFGLDVHLNTAVDKYISPFKQSPGVDVAIHENIHYPDITIYSTTIRPGSDVSLSIKPEITATEEDVRKVDIQTRGCVFANEIEMEWARSYSYTTCINECKARAVIKLCNCVPYYYPIKGKRFCTLHDMFCLKKNKINSKGTKITYNYFQDVVTNKKASGDVTTCKCYPQCNEISYSYQQDLEPLKTSELQSNDSILHVYFGHVSCTKLLRSVFFTWELILASVGGLIGLCLGGSILSIIEFFYHVLETIFSTYSSTKSRKHEEKPYTPKLYLSDFGSARNPELFRVSNIKNN